VAEVVLKPDPQLFPVATTVKVKTAPATGGRLVGEPPGTTLSEPVVASAGTLTVTGLTQGVRYVGWASVGGSDHYLSFQADVPSGGGGASGVIALNEPKCVPGARTPEWVEVAPGRIMLKGRIKVKELTKPNEAASAAKALPAPAVGCAWAGCTNTALTGVAKCWEVNTEGTLLAKNETNNEDLSIEGLSYFL